MEPTITYDIFHKVYWDWRIAADLFLGGIGAGAFIFAVLISWYYKDKYRTISKIGALVAPIGIALGGLFLLAELSQPLRFQNTLIFFNITSPLSWGGLIQICFIGVAVLYAGLWWRGEKSVRRIVGWIGTPIALVLGAYHGFLMSFLYMRPLWSTGPYNIVHLLSTVTTGIAAVCLLALLRKQSREELKEIKQVVGGVLGFALLLQIAANIGWLSALAYGGAPAENAHRSLMAHFSLPYWLVAFSIGLAVPLVLLAASALKRKSAFADAALFLGSGMVIVGGFVFRYVTIIAGQIS